MIYSNISLLLLYQSLQVYYDQVLPVTDILDGQIQCGCFAAIGWIKMCIRTCFSIVPGEVETCHADINQEQDIQLSFSVVQLGKRQQNLACAAPFYLVALTVNSHF